MGRYPLGWRQGVIQWRIGLLARWRCEHCGAAVDPTTNRTISKPMQNGEQHIIAIHHLDGNPANCHWRNLIYSCQACHLHIQGNWKPGGMLPLAWSGAPQWLLKRGLDYVEHPQLALPLFAIAE